MGRRPRLLAATVTLALLGAPALVGPSSAAPDPSKGSVSVSAPSAALVGDPIVFKGRVKPNQAGLKVGLQRRVGSGWKNVSQTRTKDGGHYRLAGSVDFGGVYKFRVIRLPWLTTSAKSRTVTVAAYVWNDVNSMLQEGDYDSGVQFPDTESIDGVSYQTPIVIDADSQGTTEGGFFEVDLDGLNCAAFDTTAGALDGNAVNSEVGLEVNADSAVIEDDTYLLGESEHLTLDVRGVSVLRVEGQVVLPGPQGKLGLGNPRMLCAS